MQGINLYPHKIARNSILSEILKSCFKFFYILYVKSMQKFSAHDSIHNVLFLTKQLNRCVKLGMYSNIRMTCIIYVGFTLYIKSLKMFILLRIKRLFNLFTVKLLFQSSQNCYMYYVYYIKL